MTEFHRVLFTGDREFREDYARIVKRELRKLSVLHGDKLVVIAGGAPGVDTLVEKGCELHSIHCAVVKALWRTKRLGAGPERNKAMLALNPHEVIAIHSNFNQSKGTKDCVTRAKALGIPTRLVKI